MTVRLLVKPQQLAAVQVVIVLPTFLYLVVQVVEAAVTQELLVPLVHQVKATLVVRRQVQVHPHLAVAEVVLAVLERLALVLLTAVLVHLTLSLGLL